jgi:phosphate transport system substrate-binding protein
MHKTQDKPVQATNALKFFEWAYVNGDKMADRPGLRAAAGLR